MPIMKVALAQINTTVGDFPGNEAKILAAYGRAQQLAADVLMVPELATAGYPPRDLLLKPSFIRHNQESIERLARATGPTALLVGYVGLNETRPGRESTNSVALLQDGKIVATRTKMLLPTYDVFDEDRYFEPAQQNTPVILNGRKVGLTICEDIWNSQDYSRECRYRRNPAVDLEAAGAEVIFNISASPWHLGKNRVRHNLLAHLARRVKCPVLYCNLVGGNDELVFDGESLVYNGCRRTRRPGPLVH